MRNGFDRADWTLIVKGLKGVKAQTERLLRDERNGMSSDQRQGLKAKARRCAALVDKVNGIIVRL